MKQNDRPWYKSNAFNYTLIGLAVVGIAIQSAYLVDLLKAAEADKEGG